ncbi:MAG: tRNA pseudouridine(55) synthase TruB [Acholeplasmatales bacterium]|nr:tRNA pseudouridine(55) synthase TruB [Acholeplasmatales bacterium]
MDGFIILDKPKGITSQTALNKIKTALNVKKIGHNGTLDPNATGVMVVAIGKATKLIKYLDKHDKTYLATIVFGLDSDTLDICGKITNDIKMEPSIDNIKKALDELKKEEKQIPPITSAIKVDGMKLYEYQRKNIDVNIEARDVKLYDYSIESDLRFIDNHYEIDILLHVSKGFYIRSLARDLGKKLNGCAILKDLRRTKSGEFSLKDSIKIEDVNENKVISIFDMYKLPIVEVSDYLEKLVLNGVMLDERQAKLDSLFYVKSKSGIIAMYEPIERYKYRLLIIFRE